MLSVAVNGRNRFCSLVTQFIDILFAFHLDCVKESRLFARRMNENLKEIEIQIDSGIEQGCGSGTDACERDNSNKLSGRIFKTSSHRKSFRYVAQSGIFGEVAARWIIFQNKFIAHVQNDRTFHVYFPTSRKDRSQLATKEINFFRECLISDLCACVDSKSIPPHRSRRIFTLFGCSLLRIWLQITNTHEAEESSHYSPEIWYRRFGKFVYFSSLSWCQFTPKWESKDSLPTQPSRDGV